MYCEYCGTKLEDGATFCDGCGVKVGDGVDPMTGHQIKPRVESEPDPELTRRSALLSILCFIIPLLGLILWATMRGKHPGLAISAAKGALICLCFFIPVLGLILFLTRKNKNWEIAKACGITAIVGEASAILFGPIIIYAFVIFMVLSFGV